MNRRALALACVALVGCGGGTTPGEDAGGRDAAADVGGVSCRQITAAAGGVSIAIGDGAPAPVTTSLVAYYSEAERVLAVSSDSESTPRLAFEVLDVRSSPRVGTVLTVDPLAGLRAVRGAVDGATEFSWSGFSGSGGAALGGSLTVTVVEDFPALRVRVDGSLCAPADGQTPAWSAAWNGAVTPI